MSSNLNVKQGIYDPTKRFSFTNISSAPFTFYWAKSPITVKAKETVELPHHLAVLATNQLVDQIFMAEIKEEEVKMAAETKNPLYRSPRAISMGVPAVREVYENKILKELKPNESKISESQLGVIRSQLRDTLINDTSAKSAAPITGAMAASIVSSEFEDVNIPKK